MRKVVVTASLYFQRQERGYRQDEMHSPLINVFSNMPSDRVMPGYRSAFDGRDGLDVVIKRRQEDEEEKQSNATRHTVRGLRVWKSLR